SAMIDQALMVSSRAQADLYAQAGVDWARGVLAEDARRTREVDTLDEGWAQPIAALPVDRALVAGSIGDEQGRFNLNNVMNGNTPSGPDIRMLREILAHVGLAPELAEAIVDWIDADADLSGSGGAEDAFYLGLQRPYRAANRPMVQLEELYRVRGFDAAAVAKLRPWVTALPVRTATNVNTAGDVVIAALLGVSRDKAAALIAERRAKPFAQKGDFTARIASLGAAAAIPEYDVKSAHFLVRVRVAQDDVHLATEALVRRVESGATDIIWRRPRY
ncbi:MAG TPA: type II secretion system minor pseudopilin GspK, partial [Usitatibacter sp.]|nr:type II secretion system minor pseudopilin GspK [Usitatibacter sp.]